MTLTLKKSLTKSDDPLREELVEKSVNRLLSLHGKYRRVLWPLGGAQEIGRSCLFLWFGGKKFILDCGVLNRRGERLYPYFEHLQKTRLDIDAIFITHAHLDHIGGLYKIFEYINPCPVYMTKTTKKLSEVMLRDAAKVGEEMGLPFDDEESKFNLDKIQIREVEFYVPVRFGEVTVTFLEAGHIPGSAMILFQFSGKNILYTGDFNLNDTALMRGAAISKLREMLSDGAYGEKPLDYIITEGTYCSSKEEIMDTKKEEERLVKFISHIIDRGGKVLIPVFALGRTQEILTVILRAIKDGKLPYDLKVYLSGLAQTTTKLLEEEFDRSVVGMFNKIMMRNVENVNYSELNKSVILATPGMMTGGISANIAKRVINEPESGIAVVGYQDEESPGKVLLNAVKTKKILLGNAELDVLCDIERFGISAHSNCREVIKFANKLGKRVILVHTKARKAPPKVWRAPRNLDVVVLKKPEVKAYSSKDERAIPKVKKELKFVKVEAEFDIKTDPYKLLREFSLAIRELEKQKIFVLTIKPEIPKNRISAFMNNISDAHLKVLEDELKRRGFMRVSFNTVTLKPEVVKKMPFICLERFKRLAEFLQVSDVPPPYIHEGRLIDKVGVYGLFDPRNEKIKIDSRLKYDEKLLLATIDHETSHYLMWKFLTESYPEEVLQYWRKTELVEGFAEWIVHKMHPDDFWVLCQADKYKKGRLLFERLEMELGANRVARLLRGRDPFNMIIKLSLKLGLFSEDKISINLRKLIFKDRALSEFLSECGGYSNLNKGLSVGKPLWIASPDEAPIIITPYFVLLCTRDQDAYIIEHVEKPNIRHYDTMIFTAPYMLKEQPRILLSRRVQETLKHIEMLEDELKHALKQADQILELSDRLRQGIEILESGIEKARKMANKKGFLSILTRRRGRKYLRNVKPIKAEIESSWLKLKRVRRQVEAWRAKLIEFQGKVKELLFNLKFSTTPIPRELAKKFVYGKMIEEIEVPSLPDEIQRELTVIDFSRIDILLCKCRKLHNKL